MAEDELPLKSLAYECDGVRLEGVLAGDDAEASSRPGILIVHDAWGIGDNVRLRARMLAKLGYVALGADIYGEGRRPAVVAEAQAEVDRFKADPGLLRARALAGLEALSAVAAVDTARLGAIGYCFGGMTVLEMARAGADCAAIVSFHGLLTTARRAAPGAIRARLLVCSGSDDPLVPIEHIADFQKEIGDAGADCETIIYTGAKHSFANPFAGSIPGVEYHPEADRRSWAAMRAVFDDVFQAAR
jgi:dienelactone hydrolase